MTRQGTTALTTIRFSTTNEGLNLIVGFQMLAERIYSAPQEVDQRLESFGVTRQELLAVVAAVVGARAEAVPDDPLSAEGQFAYIYGTRHLRALLKPKKWSIHREQNVEAVKHPTLNLRIVYQSVDVASSELHSPRAVSGKGAGADRIINTAQGSLFTKAQLDGVRAIVLGPINAGVWFFCVSVDGDDVRAELSLPSSIEGGNFRGFVERIFIVGDGDWNVPKVMSHVDEAVEFEPVVTRRNT